MSKKKKKIREEFRDSVFERDRYRCQGPGCFVFATPENATEILDAHHICNRNFLPGGGFVLQNGITLCKKPGGCHEKAESAYAGEDIPGYSEKELYQRIGSSYEIAYEASKRSVE